MSRPEPGKPRSRITLYLGAGLGAAVFVAVLDVLTNRTPPLWDGLHYLDIAERGWIGNPDLTAPFAYRPGMPLLARWVSGLLGLDVVTGFVVVVHAAAITLLVATLALALRIDPRPRTAGFIALVVGLGAQHVKFPLFFPTLVDAAAYPLLVVAVLRLAAGKHRSALAISWVGLLFKEFLVLPVALYLARWTPSGAGRRTGPLVPGIVLLVTLGVVLVPRLVLPVRESLQEIDPIHAPETLRNLYLDLLDPKRDANVIFATAGYWLPTLMLLTGPRIRTLRRDLAGQGTGWAAYLGLVLLLTVYGGTNYFVFASYAVAAQIVFLAHLLRRNIPPVELLLVLLAVAVYNRIWADIPLPGDGFKPYIEFYGGWAGWFGWAALGRIGEMLAYLALVNLVRAALSRPGARRTRKPQEAG